MKDIRRATRRQFSAEEKIRIVLESLRCEDSIDPGYGIKIMVLAATLTESVAPQQAASLLEEPAPDLAALPRQTASGLSVVE